MNWTQKHFNNLSEAVHNLKVKFLLDDDVEDELDELFDAIDRIERILDYLETRNN